jgi:hypothetical protein
MVTRGQIIKDFLENTPDYDNLADLYALYRDEMQCHVVVAADNGKRDGLGWTDGVSSWYPFVISDQDSLIKHVGFDLRSHVEGIGLTGWNWKEKCSMWVAFDFDSLVNHKQGLTESELKDIANAVSNIEWVTIRHSTSGKGYHIYVRLDPAIPTDNRAEHSALARAVLHRMTALTGYNFKDKIDVCGGNMWVWHRKMRGTNGLELIKSGIPLNNLPNWKEHIDVITQSQRKPRDYDTLVSARTNIKLDASHLKLLNWLQDNGCTWWWDNDRHLLVTHSIDLKQAHESLELKGLFETNSSRTTTHNVFCFPLRCGAWVVRRFGKGCTEHESWEVDANGWTRCYFNTDLDINTASRTFGGTEHPNGGFIFGETESAVKAALSLGVHLDLPPKANLCTCRMKEHRDGRLIVEIFDKENHLAGTMDGWIRDGHFWKKLYNKNRQNKTTEELENFDDLIRHLISPSGEDQGWAIYVNGEWTFEILTHIKLALASLGYKQKEINEILGSSVLKGWKLVNVPFATEYPGDRSWNLNGAQLVYQPTITSIDSLQVSCPHWWSIIEHIGQSLDEAVSTNDWALSNRIYTGADYITCWISSLFQESTQPLPYLFLYGKQNTGKSILHEALSLLMTKGYVRADNALTSQGGFNAELESAVLCVVEETNLKTAKEASNRIKDWVTARELSIHHKGKTPYMIKNVTHWMQFSNEYDACPVFPGDTRIVVIHVNELKSIVPKKRLIEHLKEEASAFMNYILNFQIPESPDRLNVPVLQTTDKFNIAESNKSLVEVFIEEKCHSVPGHLIKFSDMYQEFINWLGPTTDYWGKKRFSKELPPHILRGRSPQNNQLYVANLTMYAEAEPGMPYRVIDGKVTQ